MHSAIIFSAETLGAVSSRSRSDRYSSELEPVNLAPRFIVLQPNGALTDESSSSFWQVLEEALDLAAESVVIDLLWVENTDSIGISTLVAGVEKAASLGKVLSFQSMNRHTQRALEIEWEQRRQQQLGDWSDRCESRLEKFLREGRRV